MGSTFLPLRVPLRKFKKFRIGKSGLGSAWPWPAADYPASRAAQCGRRLCGHGTGRRSPAIEHPVAVADSLVGQRIDHFQIHELLGEGGMGAVYLAHDMSLERTVAIKVLRRELASDERLVGRLVMEAQAQACPAAPQRRDHLLHRQFPRRALLRDGARSRRHAGRVHPAEGPLPWGEALEYIIQATRALAAAHGRGMVHRDIKPSNLLLVAIPAGEQSHAIKVADFGVAAPTDAGAGAFVARPTMRRPNRLPAKAPACAATCTRWP